jgi:hypothetical protein
MIWFYERGTETLRLETRFNNQARIYELVWHYPDGSTRVETFVDEAAFRTRSEQVEASLLDEHWQPAGSPQLLREGWKVG